MNEQVSRWVRISLFNLMIVSLLGVVLRYKIIYSLPFVDYKNLLHGHSHFAFAGWISHALMCMMICYVSSLEKRIMPVYKWLILANLITAYGMLISFPIQGYGPFSIVLSTLSIFVSYAFAFVYWKHLNRLPKNSVHLWFKASLVFSVISSLAIFTLAAITALKITDQHAYMAAVYAFLHFQYNGWFMFVSFGLLALLLKNKLHLEIPKSIFWLFAGSAAPACILSMLWLNIPAWLYALAILSVIAQAIGFLILLRWLIKHKTVLKNIPIFARSILMLVAFAFALKILLQLVSVFPAVNNLAFSLRPFVVGYLHLVLLGIVSLFILAYFSWEKHLNISPTAVHACCIFIAGFVANEILLVTQGIFSFVNGVFKFAGQYLLIAAIMMALGLVLLNASQKDATTP